MPATVKPLFRPEAVSGSMDGFALPTTAAAGRDKLRKWAGLLGTPAGLKLKETQVRDEFLYDVFRDLLGYTTAAQNPADYRFNKEQFVQIDGTYADAGFGLFGGAEPRFVLVLEGKGPKDPLDRPYAGRKRSAYEQALLYAVNLQLDWFLVTSLTETRLHYKGADQATYERFPLKELADDDAAFARFVFLLGADRVAPAVGGANHLTDLLTRSRKVSQRVTNDYYAAYRDLREQTFAALCRENPGEPPAKLLSATQKLLDRVLFVCFCEDRRLMPDGIIDRAYETTNPFTGGAIYPNFVGLFRAVDGGSHSLDIARYNGGLFAPDPYLDNLVVPNAICEGFRKLAGYEYGTGKASGADQIIDVEILGHIFEQSISDLEEMKKAAGGKAAKPKKQKADEQSSRRKTGAFYTPAYITRYIVGQTVGPVVAARFERLRAAHQRAAGSLKKQKTVAVAALADPTAPVPDKASKDARAAVTEALAGFWAAWMEELPKFKVVDPACGSGAFLIEAFDQLFAEYERAERFLQALGRPSGLFRPRKTILANNLFGVDHNGDAVEIARLSCWIKTAELGEELTSLDDTIRQGNSLLADDPETAPRNHWTALFPDVMAAGGFDAVVGNPPYVRAESIKTDKARLQQHYATFHGSADLYVYFYELALDLLKPDGRLGFIVTNKWLKADYGELLRTHYSAHARVDRLIDFGHAKAIFPDADVFPCVLIAGRADPAARPPVRVCNLVGKPLAFADVNLAHEIETRSHDLPAGRLTPRRWLVGSPAELDLFEQMERTGRPLTDVIGSEPLYGIKTGFNPAFLLETPEKESLVAADPASDGLFRPYLRGEDLDRWYAPGAGLWMLAMKSSGNHPWPWAGLPDIDAEAVFRRTYPALFAHMDAHRAKLIAREDQGRYWWELRACSYWDAFDRPKVMYQEIQFHPGYLLGGSGPIAVMRCSAG